MTDQFLLRKKDRLLRDMDLRMRLNDINRLHRLKDRLAPHWWEPTLLIVFFVAALGLLVSLMGYTKLRDHPLDDWMLFWFGMMILTMGLCFQVILIKIYNFRRVGDLLMRMVEEMRKEQDKIMGEIEAARAVEQEPEPPDTQPQTEP